MVSHLSRIPTTHCKKGSLLRLKPNGGEKIHAGKRNASKLKEVLELGWFPEYETPAGRLKLQEKIKKEVESWNQYCEERFELQALIDGDGDAKERVRENG